MYNEDILKVLRPFVEAKVHNPNKSSSEATSRVLNIKAADIAALKVLYIALRLEAPKAGADDIISRLVTRLAYMERDSRVTYRANQALIRSGALDEEAYQLADQLVHIAVDKDDFLNVDRIRAGLAKEYLSDE